MSWSDEDWSNLADKQAQEIHRLEAELAHLDPQLAAARAEVERLRDAIISAISDLSDAREHNLTAMLESDDPDGNAEEFARFAVEHAAKAIATMRLALRPAPESKEARDA